MRTETFHFIVSHYRSTYFGKEKTNYKTFYNTTLHCPLTPVLCRVSGNIKRQIYICLPFLLFPHRCLYLPLSLATPEKTQFHLNSVLNEQKQEGIFIFVQSIKIKERGNLRVEEGEKGKKMETSKK